MSGRHMARDGQKPSDMLFGSDAPSYTTSGMQVGDARPQDQAGRKAPNAGKSASEYKPFGTMDDRPASTHSGIKVTHASTGPKAPFGTAPPSRAGSRSEPDAPRPGTGAPKIGAKRVDKNVYAANRAEAAKVTQAARDRDHQGIF
ncbi:hypothetical protein FOA52_000939 [Chlamydomonas sp. UWO 241]|nr:hypothetical protein FOA52_000939 [Chlamydomonas sp. UWO 241]